MCNHSPSPPTPCYPPHPPSSPQTAYYSNLPFTSFSSISHTYALSLVHHSCLSIIIPLYLSTHNYSLSLALTLSLYQSPSLSLSVSLYLSDEPTNHLDMGAIEALANALKGFSGGVLVISHDQVTDLTSSLDLCTYLDLTCHPISWFLLYFHEYCCGQDLFLLTCILLQCF